jgi:hypothetical protein
MDLDNLTLIGKKLLYLRLRMRARYSSSCPRSTLLQVAKERLCTMSSLPSLLKVPQNDYYFLHNSIQQLQV